MGNSKSLIKRRNRLWIENPACYWCGIETIMPPKNGKGKIPLNTATIDHLRSRYDPLRRTQPEPGEVRTVLACSKCNNERSRIETAAQSKEELIRRSKMHRKGVNENAMHM